VGQHEAGGDEEGHPHEDGADHDRQPGLRALREERDAGPDEREGEDEGGRFHPVALNDTFFLACASVGPDSRAVAEVSLALKRRIGKLAYAAAFGRILFDWRRPRICRRPPGRRDALALTRW
jgi:hypothetical protein